MIENGTFQFGATPTNKTNPVLILIGLVVLGFQNCSNGLKATGTDGASISEVQAVSGNLFPAGDLDTEEHVSKFSQNSNAAPGGLSYALSAEAAREGQRGLHLKDHYFTVNAPNLPTLDVNKYNTISFWGKFKRRPGVSADPAQALPELIVRTGRGDYWSGPRAKKEDYFQNISTMTLKSSSWTKLEAIFKPTGPQMYFEFWVMLGVNEVDVDQFRIEEVALNDRSAEGGKVWRTLLRENFEAIVPATYMARSSNTGGFGEFDYEIYGNMSQIVIADALGVGSSRGVRLAKDYLGWIWIFQPWRIQIKDIASNLIPKSAKVTRTFLQRA